MSGRSSTSKWRRRSSTPAWAIFSLIRTRKWFEPSTVAAPPAVSPRVANLRRLGGGQSGLEEDLLGRADAGPERNVCPELAQRHLARREGSEDVERAVVTAVGDPHDLSLEPPL